MAGDHMNVWCMGCGEEDVLDPVDVVGLGVLMLCDRCYRELQEAGDGN
jgi:hypothetical protein